ncbi:outer membrane beta-barrel protein [Pseudomonas sp. D4002]|uniref:outer membrane beta-barrel protein n=1 Tax=Pseudomonas sp. D4002 TaxID=2738817 RepID=UPI0015A2CB0B|nr:outer membrane beta-barrel protein [Pseudomonas sp. D4002]NWB20973.1 outer membrane beta-barrel protein [Pseudomonas sp. D4002]
MKTTIRHCFTGALPLSLFTPENLYAQPEDHYGEGSLANALAGETLNKWGIHVSGLLDVGYSRNNRSYHDERRKGLSNLPIAGESDEGFELRSVHLFIEKPIIGNFIPRITPLPGPNPEQLSFGFSIEALYGRNAQFARTFGWDMHWEENSPGDDDSEAAKRNRQLFLAMPNVLATAYLPWGPGVTVWGGLFGPAIGNEIPPNPRQSRNLFATKSYSFVTEPGTVFGLVAALPIYKGDSGIISVEGGPVRGINNMRDNNDVTSLIGAVRWRSPNMKTWLDYEFYSGAEQNASFGDIQMPTARLLSTRDQQRKQHAVTLWHEFDSLWNGSIEAVYGEQNGDGRIDTIDLVTGEAFNGAHWWGANASISYRATEKLTYSTRIEYFNDPQGYALFPVSTARGAFNAITAGLRYDLNNFVSLRPELRYDWQSATDDKAFGSARNQSQFTSTFELLVYF